MSPASQTVNGKSICPASVNHVSIVLDLVVSLNWSMVASAEVRRIMNCYEHHSTFPKRSAA